MLKLKKINMIFAKKSKFKYINSQRNNELTPNGNKKCIYTL